MSSLFDLLPLPKLSTYEREEETIHPVIENEKNEKKSRVKKSYNIPEYPNRSNWVPKSEDDYCLGGAYPEIHLCQYPLDMGKKSLNLKEVVSNTQSSKAILPYHISSETDITDLVREGHRDDKIVYHNILDTLAPSIEEKLNFSKPSLEVQKTLTERTAKEIQKRANTRVAISHKIKAKEETTSMRPYFLISSMDDANENHIVQVIDEEDDPLDLPKFRTRRLHRAPPSPPVPVVHSPKKKASKETQKMWDLPPCISNWKNPRGYTIPLDKRLAADGRGLKEHLISERFSALAEAMYVAENTAREEVEKHAKFQEAILLKQQEQEEEKMRKLAEEARLSKLRKNTEDRREEVEMVPPPNLEDDRRRPRSNVAPQRKFLGDRERRSISPRRREYENRDRSRNRDERERHREYDNRDRSRYRDERDRNRDYGDSGRKRISERDEEDESFRRRERIRRKIREDVEKERKEKKFEEIRMKRRGKKEYNDKKERDISEKMALGIVPDQVGTSDRVDSRLYEQAGKGLDQGFSRGDEHVIYEKPLRSIRGDVYTVDEKRMRRNIGDLDEYQRNKEKFESERRGLGADEENETGGGGRAAGPVMFEREQNAKTRDMRREEDVRREKESREKDMSKGDDPFQFLGLMDKVRTGNKRARPKMGIMQAIAGGTQDREYYKNSSKRRKIQFEKGK